jgi:hypothetical protein
MFIRGKRSPLLEEFSSRTDLVLGASVPMPTCAVVVVMQNNQTAKALSLFIGQNLKIQNTYSFPDLVYLNQDNEEVKHIKNANR